MTLEAWKNFQLGASVSYTSNCQLNMCVHSKMLKQHPLMEYVEMFTMPIFCIECVQAYQSDRVRVRSTPANRPVTSSESPVDNDSLMDAGDVPDTSRDQKLSKIVVETPTIVVEPLSVSNADNEDLSLDSECETNSESVEDCDDMFASESEFNTCSDSRVAHEPRVASCVLLSCLTTKPCALPCVLTVAT